MVWVFEQKCFSRLLKVASDCEATTSAGRLFHRRGAEASKARSLAVIKALFWQTKHVCGSVQFGSVRFTLVECAFIITFGSLWFNMASVDIINFENKYDYPDNYELQQHRRSSVAVKWYKKCITITSSTVLLGITRATRHKFGAIPMWRWFFCFTFTFNL